MSTEMLEVLAEAITDFNNSEYDRSVDSFVETEESDSECIFNEEDGYLYENNKDITKKVAIEGMFNGLRTYANSIRSHGGCWYYNNVTHKRQVTDLVICKGGEIGVVGLKTNAPSYSVNRIILVFNNGRRPDEDDSPMTLITDFSIDGDMKKDADPMIMLDPEKWERPAHLLYNIETGEFICYDIEKAAKAYVTSNFKYYYVK